MKTYKKLLTFAWLCFILSKSGTLNAQGLGLNNSTPNASAILDAVSTSKGILVPRMTSAQRDAILTPATGLLVYVTDKTTGFFYYNGTKWVNVFSPSSVIVKRKPADESVCGTGGACVQNTGAALQNDDDLVLALQANETYLIEGCLFMAASNSTSNCKIGFTMPAGSSMSIGYHANYGTDNTNIATGLLTISGSSSNMIPSQTADNPIFISGCIVTSAVAGNLTLQFSQGVNDNTASTTIKTNSFLKAQLVK